MKCRPAVLLVAAFSAAATITAHAQFQTPPGSGLTLTSAIERALSANPTISAARMQRPIDLAGVGVAGQRPNPEVAYEISKETPRQSIGGTLPIELGGKRARRLDLANATVAVGDADLARVINEIRNDVRRAYFDVVAADTRLQIATDIRELAQRAREAARARVTAGDVPQSDLTQADLVFAITESDLTQARGEAAATRADLNALMGQAADTPLVLADALTAGTLPPPADALALATHENSELHVMDLKIAEQSARLNLTKTLTTPDIAAGSAFTYDAEPEFKYGWRASFGFTVPVFSNHKPEIVLEEATLRKLQADRAALVAKMSGSIAAALSRANAARERITLYENTILPLARDAERQAQVAYTGGQIGLPALVQALQLARETRQRGLESGLEYQHALADLERAIGAAIR